MNERLEQIKEIERILNTQENGEFVTFRLDDIQWLINHLEEASRRIDRSIVKYNEHEDQERDSDVVLAEMFDILRGRL